VTAWRRRQAATVAAAMGLLGLTALLSLTGLNPKTHQALLLLVWAPVLEELIFRWGFQEALLRTWPGHASAVTLASAAVFALAHAAAREPVLLPLYFLPGLTLAAVYTLKRNLTLCVLVHAGMNAIYLLFTA
jgi:membrane protease YdiL (CAAX protease family)